MQTITIGTKNQVVIPRQVRQKIAGLRPGRVVAMYVLNKDTVAIKVSEKNWLENSYGVMKKAWMKKQPIRDLEKMRDEWSDQ